MDWVFIDAKRIANSIGVAAGCFAMFMNYALFDDVKFEHYAGSFFFGIAVGSIVFAYCYYTIGQQPVDVSSSETVRKEDAVKAVNHTPHVNMYHDSNNDGEEKEREWPKYLNLPEFVKYVGESNNKISRKSMTPKFLPERSYHEFLNWLINEEFVEEVNGIYMPSLKLRGECSILRFTLSRRNRSEDVSQVENASDTSILAGDTGF